jgi:hypothetical protein
VGRFSTLVPSSSIAFVGDLRWDNSNKNFPNTTLSCADFTHPDLVLRRTYEGDSTAPTNLLKEEFNLLAWLGEELGDKL